MKKTIIIVAIVAVLLIGSATVALASDGWKTPAEIVAALSGKTVDQVQADRQSGDSYCEQAAAAGKQDEFMAEKLAQCNNGCGDRGMGKGPGDGQGKGCTGNGESTSGQGCGTDCQID